jgi:hypothetical protein
MFSNEIDKLRQTANKSFPIPMLSTKANSSLIFKDIKLKDDPLIQVPDIENESFSLESLVKREKNYPWNNIKVQMKNAFCPQCQKQVLILVSYL